MPKLFLSVASYLAFATAAYADWNNTGATRSVKFAISNSAASYNVLNFDGTNYTAIANGTFAAPNTTLVGFKPPNILYSSDLSQPLENTVIRMNTFAPGTNTASLAQNFTSPISIAGVALNPNKTFLVASSIAEGFAVFDVSSDGFLTSNTVVGSRGCDLLSPEPSGQYFLGVENSASGYPALVVLSAEDLTLSSAVINMRCTPSHAAFYPSNATQATDVFVLCTDSTSGLTLIYDYGVNYLPGVLNLVLAQTVDLFASMAAATLPGAIPRDWQVSEDGHIYVIMAMPGGVPDVIGHWQIVPSSTENVSPTVQYVDIVSALVINGSIEISDQYLFAWSTSRLTVLEKNANNGSLSSIFNSTWQAPIDSLEIIG